MSSQYMLSIIIDVMGAIVGNSGRVLDLTWDWREKEAHFMQSNKGQQCDLCGKGEAKTRDKDVSLQINAMYKRYVAYAMKNAISQLYNARQLQSCQRW